MDNRASRMSTRDSIFSETHSPPPPADADFRVNDPVRDQQGNEGRILELYTIETNGKVRVRLTSGGDVVLDAGSLVRPPRYTIPDSLKPKPLPMKLLGLVSDQKIDLPTRGSIATQQQFFPMTTVSR